MTVLTLAMHAANTYVYDAVGREDLDISLGDDEPDEEAQAPPAHKSPAQQPWFSQSAANAQPSGIAQPQGYVQTQYDPVAADPLQPYAQPRACTCFQQQGVTIRIAWGPMVDRCTCSQGSSAPQPVQAAAPAVAAPREPLRPNAPKQPTRGGTQSLPAPTQAPWSAMFDKVRSGVPAARPQRRGMAAPLQPSVKPGPLRGAFK